MIGKLFILPIRLYQLLISPLLGNNCRYHPSCSSYSIECFRELPFYKAMWYSMMRIIKCHPLSEGGYDPVPKVRIKNGI